MDVSLAVETNIGANHIPDNRLWSETSQILEETWKESFKVIICYSFLCVKDQRKNE